VNLQWDIWQSCRIGTVILWSDCPEYCSTSGVSGYWWVNPRSSASYWNNQKLPWLNSKSPQGTSKASPLIRISGHAYCRCSRYIEWMNIFIFSLFFVFIFLLFLLFFKIYFALFVFFEDLPLHLVYTLIMENAELFM